MGLVSEMKTLGGVASQMVKPSTDKVFTAIQTVKK